MSQLRSYRCDKCNNEWDGYCPICANCANVGYELPDGEWERLVDHAENIANIQDDIDRRKEELEGDGDYAIL